MCYDDDATMDMPCPNCDRNTALKLNDILLKPEYVCPHCGKTVAIDEKELAAFRPELEEAIEKLLDNLPREIHTD
jgi:endogenous inhibitor of DNA gyrase (YacG/DUF329 family)